MHRVHWLKACPKALQSIAKVTPKPRTLISAIQCVPSYKSWCQSAKAHTPRCASGVKSAHFENGGFQNPLESVIGRPIIVWEQ
jgi:hypothetical protein